MNTHSPVPFSEVSLASAEHFRLLMDAMARPGTVGSVPDIVKPVDNMNSGAALIAATLCDHETPVWLDPDLKTEAVKEFFRFNCASPFEEQKNKSTFGFFGSVPEPAALKEFSMGTPANPDRSSTIVIQVKSIEPEGPIALSGPGIQSTHKAAIEGVGQEFWNWWRDNGARFPLGNDVYFVSDQHLLALPRTTKVLGVS